MFSILNTDDGTELIFNDFHLIAGPNMFSILNIDDEFAERIIIRIFCFVIDEYDDYVQSLKKLLLSFKKKKTF